MVQLVRFLAIAGAALLLSATQWGQVAHASGGLNDVQTVALHQQACMATTTGPLAGSARFSLDDQGGGNVNPNGIEIRASVTAGMPRTSYEVDVVDAACHVLDLGGTLKTDDRGRGDFEFHVLGSVVPPDTNVRVLLTASTDILISDAVTAP
jgi:hypothetical protein